jgi:hypothetical protein
MTFKVFHQVGHNPSWNISSFTDDSCGDGLILSPVHQDPGSVEKLPAAIRAASMFDPQFYLPSSQKPKLKAYSFFPETFVNGFTTTSFEAAAKQAATECVNFQLSQGFRNIVIPVRYLDQMYSDFIEQHESFSVIPFLEALSEIDRPVCLTLALTSHMIQDEKFRNHVLNWVTKYPEIDQIYLIYSFERDTKQIKSSDFLSSALAFSKEIIATGLELIVGYQNTESLLFTLIDNITVTYGTFEYSQLINSWFLKKKDEAPSREFTYLAFLTGFNSTKQNRYATGEKPRIFGIAPIAAQSMQRWFLNGLWNHISTKLNCISTIFAVCKFNSISLNPKQTKDVQNLLNNGLRRLLRSIQVCRRLALLLKSMGTAHIWHHGSLR